MAMEHAPDPFRTDMETLPSPVGHPSPSDLESRDHKGSNPRDHKWPLDLPRSAPAEVVIVDDRPFFRDCLGRGLSALDPTLKLTYLSNTVELEESDAVDGEQPRLILISTPSSNGGESTLSLISRIKDVAPSASVIVLSDTEEFQEILQAFKIGVSGYIPASIGLDVAVKAMQLVAAGGIYVPASILSGCAEAVKGLANASKAQDQAENAFTSKQIAVMEALRRGKANKAIAYDLNMCESTVKVHVRTIMKKLHARNRTEAALILNEQFNNGMEVNGGGSIPFARAS
jgi:DNA-binding NarL/FixJ family response regulator